MGKARKRKRDDDDASKRENLDPKSPVSPVHRDLLSLYYNSVTSLRSHLLAGLPSSSRLRRRKIKLLGTSSNPSPLEAQLAYILDHALVCGDATHTALDEVRWAQWRAYSSTQGQDESTVTITGGPTDAAHLQAEVVDFVVWSLFQREKGTSRPRNLLCDGLKRTHSEVKAPTTVNGVSIHFANSQVVALKSTPWSALLRLLGSSGERLMMNLLLDWSIFMPLKAGYQNYYQLSGP